MKTSRTTIALGGLIPGHAQELGRIVRDDDPAPLAADDCNYPPIVRITKSGGYAVVDGFHRLAGMVAAGETRLPVVVVTGADDLCARIDCDSALDCPEIASIYTAAGL